MAKSNPTPQTPRSSIKSPFNRVTKRASQHQSTPTSRSVVGKIGFGLQTPPATPLVGDDGIAVFEGVGVKSKPPPVQPVFHRSSSISRIVSTKTKPLERFFAVFGDGDAAPAPGYGFEDVFTTSATETQIEIGIEDKEVEVGDVDNSTLTPQVRNHLETITLPFEASVDPMRYSVEVLENAEALAHHASREEITEEDINAALYFKRLHPLRPRRFDEVELDTNTY